MKELTKNDVEIAILTLTHNLKCVEEAQQEAKAEDKKKFNGEKSRLTRLLNYYKKLESEMG